MEKRRSEISGDRRGGETLLYPSIDNVCREAKKRGFYVAVTTNGTIRRSVWADRVHISFDEIHGTSFEQTLQAIRFFKQFIPKVGINHIVTDFKHLREAKKLPVDTFTLLMEKPKTDFIEWEKAFTLFPKEKLWIDACLAQKLGIRKCRQGITSMSINQQLKASRCSNINTKVLYLGLRETWSKVQGQKCPVLGEPSMILSPLP